MFRATYALSARGIRTAPALAACFAAWALTATLIPSPAGAAKLAGVELPEKASVGDAELVLNGLGLRKKAVFKVYVAGLYLPAKASDAATILAQDGPRHLVMQFVRKVGKDSLTGAWNECLEKASPAPSTAVKEGFAKLNSWMQDVAKRDQLLFTYLPGTGTSIRVAGKEHDPVAGKEFADALFACWIGDHPPSADFKTGLLGQ